ncbi:MAG: PAS domain-containing sensor histidine kinase [Alphaproteobacteria bacterium]|nr:MAG: PAS domain-containing sensor histidine kinase [Alphaproteobacteria bacterium]
MSDETLSEDLADLYENAPCGYLSLSPTGRIIKANQTLARWLGLAPEALPQKTIYDLLSFGGRIAFETHLAPMLRLQGNVEEIALDLLTGDGSKLPVIANAAERRDSSGAHDITRITLFKATDRRAYERGLIIARDEAQQAVIAGHEAAILREQFIAVLGHDLRNPLAALGAGVHMLAGRETLSERGCEIVKQMGASVSRANALIEDVLDLARGRLGNGLTVARSAEFSLAPLLEQVVAEVRAGTNREIAADFAIGAPVACDPGRISQLASNLLSNAVAHGAPGSPIRFSAYTTRDQFYLTVANAGAPIPPEAKAQLFHPFFRGSVRRSQQGLGLGLFIVSEIAKAHGGNMEVISSEDETRFTFSMPLVTPMASVDDAG